MKKHYAKTHWTIEDVRQAAEDNELNWTDEKCLKWLKENESAINDAQVSAGNDYIADALMREAE